MKLAEHLAAHITPEWTSQYIRYEEMKEILYALEQESPIDGKLQRKFLIFFIFFLTELKILDEVAFKRYCVKVDERFFQRCDQELAKINTFFAGMFLFFKIRKVCLFILR